MTAASTAYYEILDTPVGALFVGGSNAGLHRVDFLDGDGHGVRSLERCLAALERDADGPARRDPAAARPAVTQLRAYFAGERATFDLPLSARGSEWQLAVWAALQEIPPGETRSYGAIAVRLGRPGAARAVGAANGQNPIAVIVPCHRVVGADGALTGYGGGIERKRWLLSHEACPLPLFAAAS